MLPQRSVLGTCDYHRGIATTSAPALTPALLDAGRETFKKFGYQGATVERIAAEAGVSRVTLHRRKVSKDVLLVALAEEATAAYRAAMWPALTSEGLGAERLQAALEALCQSAEEHLELLVALRAQSDAIFHRENDRGLTRSVFTEPLERLIRDGITDGSLRPDPDPVEMATVLFNLVGWTYIHLRTGHGWDPQRAAPVTIDVALNGLTNQAR